MSHTWRALSAPELSVICKNCGEEVSPYVTECPYCGTRLRKRAPKLERVGDEVRLHEDRRAKRRRKAADRRAARSVSVELGTKPIATFALLAASAVLLIVQRAAGLTLTEVGAIVGPVGDEWWRYFAAPFVYDNVGYLFACGLAIAIFLPGVEARVGTIPALLLAIALRRPRDARRRRSRQRHRRRVPDRRRRQRHRARRVRGLVRHAQTPSGAPTRPRSTTRSRLWSLPSSCSRSRSWTTSPRSGRGPRGRRGRRRLRAAATFGGRLPGSR